MRVCYLIQSHRDPQQLRRLVATLGRSSPNCLVLVMHDEAHGSIDPASLPCEAELHYRAVSTPVKRGYLSMLDPYLAGVEWLRRRSLDYDWLVYLSGQDYPTQPLAESEAGLAATPVDGYLRHWPALSAEGPWRRRRQGLRRYFYRYRDAPAWALPLLRPARALNGIQSWMHVHLVYGPRVGLRLRRTPFDRGRVCYVGWQWTTLRRACVETLLDELACQPELVAHYRDTICPDESLVQTVLVNARAADGAPRFRFANDNLRFADNLASTDGRPRVLLEADFERLTSGDYPFARKFDPAVDSRVLDRLDSWLGERR